MFHCSQSDTTNNTQTQMENIFPLLKLFRVAAWRLLVKRLNFTGQQTWLCSPRRKEPVVRRREDQEVTAIG